MAVANPANQQGYFDTLITQRNMSWNGDYISIDVGMVVDKNDRRIIEALAPGGSIGVFEMTNAIIKCRHCGQFAARFTECKYCGAPVE